MKKDKNLLRTKIRGMRDALSKEDVLELSKSIAKNVIDSSIYQSMNHICVYQSFRNEVSCDFIMENSFQTGKRVYVPVTDEEHHRISFYEVFPDTQWISGAYGIMEPLITNDNKLLADKALVLMPGLVFDKNRNRIGYGGGYYDRYLMEHFEHSKMALCYCFQLVDEQIPSEEFDVRPDYIVTEKGIFF